PHLCPLSLHDALPISMPRHCRSRHDSLVGGGLFTCLLPWLRVSRRTEVRFSPRGRRVSERRLFVLGFAKCLRDVSTHVCDYHARSEEHTSELQSRFDL